MKKISLKLLLFLIALVLTSCNNLPTNVPDLNQTNIGKPPITVDSIPEPTPLDTKVEYLTNDQIPQGNIEDVLEESGVLGETAYFDFENGLITFLGFDKNRNLIMIEDGTTFDLVSIPKEGKKKVLFENVMGDRKREIKYGVYQEPYVVWSECPNARTIPNPTKGTDWAVYMLNIQTKELTLIDYDQGLRVDNNYPDSYLCPKLIDIDGDFIVYPGFAKNAKGIIVPIIKTFQISTEEIKIIGELKSDPFNNSFGAPSIYGNLITWPEAFFRKDGLYEGFCVLYNIDTGESKKIITPENVINPTLTNGYLVASSQPNKTFYDAEVVVLDLSDFTWKLKVNSNLSIYSKHDRNSFSITGCIDTMCAWYALSPDTDALVILDIKQQLLYTIIGKEEGHLVNYPILRTGKVLTWYEHVMTENGLKPRLYYHYIK
ncbi:MAG: hypothetical protein LLG09_01235 [Negativicutes bacterium]|nr:hypothetical protein [Negativicutes bacterium]